MHVNTRNRKARLTRPSLTRPLPEALTDINHVARYVVIQCAHGPSLVWTRVIIRIHACGVNKHVGPYFHSSGEERGEPKW
jgi:hypothetical protein